MDKEKCIFHKDASFNNYTEGGIMKARETLESLKKTNKPFLNKHSEYIEDYSFKIKELTTDLEYFIIDKEIYDPEKD